MTKVARTAEPQTQPGDGGVLEEAFARYQSELLGTLYYLVGNGDDARDALQEAFLKCWRHRDEVPQVQNLKAWIFRITLNTGRDMRLTAWRRKRQGLPEDNSVLECPHDGPVDVAEQRERLERVRTALRDLRGEEQEVFLLRQNGGMTYEEIAAAVGIPLGTVKTRMRLAITRLRQVLAET
ncbi:MAG: RNA polymerase sigma factor [Pirellulaceae bacterium]